MIELAGDYKFETGILEESPKALVVAERYNKYLRRRKFVDWKTYEGDERFFALYRYGRIVSLLGIYIDDYTGNPSIQIAWTSPRYRRLGLYSFLFRAMVAWTRENLPNATKIESGYHPGNEASAAMQKNRGSRILNPDGSYIDTEYDL